MDCVRCLLQRSVKIDRRPQEEDTSIWLDCPTQPCPIPLSASGPRAALSRGPGWRILHGDFAFVSDFFGSRSRLRSTGDARKALPVNPTVAMGEREQDGHDTYPCSLGNAIWEHGARQIHDYRWLRYQALRRNQNHAAKALTSTAAAKALTSTAPSHGPFLSRTVPLGQLPLLGSVWQECVSR